jgi:hypothetical protein
MERKPASPLSIEPAAERPGEPPAPVGAGTPEAELTAVELEERISPSTFVRSAEIGTRGLSSP